MRVVLTKIENIESKKGNFVIYKGISESGSTIEAFVTKEQADTFAIPEKAAMSKDDIASMFANAETVVDISFDQRGRVDSVVVE